MKEIFVNTKFISKYNIMARIKMLNVIGIYLIIYCSHSCQTAQARNNYLALSNRSCNNTARKLLYEDSDFYFRAIHRYNKSAYDLLNHFKIEKFNEERVNEIFHLYENLDIDNQLAKDTICKPGNYYELEKNLDFIIYQVNSLESQFSKAVDSSTAIEIRDLLAHYEGDHNRLIIENIRFRCAKLVCVNNN